ncbi:ferredoxin--NADP reductase, leaf-type isozyme, chloroplastic-like [Lycium ferocissimum]|uniref:ferredoxin--NADP reductase, leaf-type isozyme, chloroplastic-like n=1 Tax=Lycium ferocissimum TaxID=112874 RepID=UPI0028162AB6|nr:ferredoxin--NADP reductase, leaf-type isozyme, chloroplastic-like [Lycium ferocissimum]
MTKNSNATIKMLAIGTGITPFSLFLCKMFFKKHNDYKICWTTLFRMEVASSLEILAKLNELVRFSPDENIGLFYANFSSSLAAQFLTQNKWLIMKLKQQYIPSENVSM